MAIHVRDMDNSPTKQQQFRDAVIAVWDALRPERLKSMLRSMPRRLRAVQHARGEYTWYYLMEAETK